MTTSPVTVMPETTVEQAGHLLEEHDIGSVIVTDGDHVNGMVEQSDIVALALDGVDLAATSVTEITTEDPPTVTADTPLQEAVAVFEPHGHRRVPVMSDGTLVGVLTTTDVATHIPHFDRRIEADGGLQAANHPGVRKTAYDRVDWEFTEDGDVPDEIEIGETFRFAKTITDADVSAFAEASGDTNRLHLDESFAGESRFGSRIAHGMLVAGVISATLARLPGTVIYLSQALSFQRPVAIGDRVSAEVTAAEALTDDRWRFETTVFDSDGTCVVDGEATVLVQQ